MAGDDAALTATMTPGFEGRRVVVTERPLPGIAQNGGGAGAGATSGAPPAGSARLISYGAEKIVAQATATQRSVLVLTDVFYPGWNVTVDGHPASTERVDYLLRGVVLGPGKHRIVFSYEPASYEVGWIISLLSTLLVVGAALFGWRRRTRPARRSAPARPAATPV